MDEWQPASTPGLQHVIVSAIDCDGVAQIASEIDASPHYDPQHQLVPSGRVDEAGDPTFVLNPIQGVSFRRSLKVTLLSRADVDLEVVLRVRSSMIQFGSNRTLLPAHGRCEVEILATVEAGSMTLSAFALPSG